ncbi:hypothetical protein [uncultured Paraglaciecola sp.]|uniref:hypothetical protein n=1 Tax=uncultured Paraglaciecola sp. TaxID=1765024 RepID=UPI0026D7BA3E|tara:strand:+ start:18075 stop:18299 length:225 start_codon:yes stop_codon:yes gene_type:complete
MYEKQKEYQAKQREKQRLAQQKQYEKSLSKGFKPISWKPRKAIKSKGMAGASRTVEELALHNAIAELGCICCIN